MLLGTFFFKFEMLFVEQLPQDPEVILSQRKCYEISVARIGPDLRMDSPGVQ
jgi:hypothetical protein